MLTEKMGEDHPQAGHTLLLLLHELGVDGRGIWLLHGYMSVE